MPVTAEMERAITRRVSRDREPLRWRRVRHIETGREGHIQNAYGETHYMDARIRPSRAWIVWDDAPVKNGWRAAVETELSEVELIDPPAIESARIRKVLFRGHKEQVAERMRMLGPVPEGSERYVEYDPQPMSYRRWRIVYVGPPLTAEAIAEIPDQFPGAARLRQQAKDAQDYGEPDGYGY